MDYKVNDIVRIKDWEKLQEKFGLNVNGDICTPLFPFKKDLKIYGGATDKIVMIKLYNGTPVYVLEKHSWLLFTADMLELVKPVDVITEKEKEENRKRAKELLRKIDWIDRRISSLSDNTTSLELCLYGEPFFDEKILSALKICLEEEKEECGKEIIELLRKER